MYVAHRRIFADVPYTFLEFSAAILELHGNVWVGVICGLRSELPEVGPHPRCAQGQRSPDMGNFVVALKLLLVVAKWTDHALTW